MHPHPNVPTLHTKGAKESGDFKGTLSAVVPHSFFVDISILHGPRLAACIGRCAPEWHFKDSILGIAISPEQLRVPGGVSLRAYKAKSSTTTEHCHG